MIIIKPNERNHMLHSPRSMEDVDREPAWPMTCHGHFTAYNPGLHIYLTNTKGKKWLGLALVTINVGLSLHHPPKKPAELSF